MLRPSSTGLLRTWIESVAGTPAAIRTSHPRDYLIGIAAAGLATLARWLLEPWLGEGLPYPTYFLAVAVVAWYAGFLPGLVTLVASLAAAAYFFIEPRGSLAIEAVHWPGMATFAVAGFLIVLLGDTRRRAIDKSEQRRDLLRVTLASIADAVIMTDPGGRVTFLNPVAERLTGWPLQEAQARPLEAVFATEHEQTRAPLVSPVGRALAENRVVGQASQAILIARDGSEIPIDHSASPIHDERGAVVGAVLVFRDVGLRRAADRARDESEARKAAILRNALDAIITIESTGRVVEINPAAEELFGYTQAEAVGRELAELILPAELRERHREGLKRYMATGRSTLLFERLEMPARRKDGSQLLVQLSITPTRDGSRTLFSGFMRDISHEKEAERRIYELVTELKHNARRKDEFLAMLSHELRNPLAPLRLSLEIVRRAEADPALTAQAWQTMDRQLVHVERLVDDLLDISRITRDVLELRRSRVDLVGIVQQAVEASQPLCAAAKHRLDVALPPQPLPLDADAVRLVQVFNNLLNNACRYTPPGGRIQVTVAREGRQAVIAVRDSGRGIPADMLPRVFDMFMQAERGSDRTSGLGIGLTLVKRLVELHGGQVTVSSAGKDQGSEFVVRLPLAADGAEARPPEPAPVPDSRLVRRRILVVDDNVDSAMALSTILGLSGYQVRVAHDGVQALDVEAAFQPEAVLLDIGLPAMSGHEVARRIRARADGRRVLLIALTGWGQSEDRRKSSDAGFDHHMVKPVDVQALLVRLQAE